MGGVQLSVLNHRCCYTSLESDELHVYNMGEWWLGMKRRHFGKYLMSEIFNLGKCFQNDTKSGRNGFLILCLCKKCIFKRRVVPGLS